MVTQFNDDSNLYQLFLAQKAKFPKDPIDYKTRKRFLVLLREMILDHSDSFIEAVNKDYGCRSKDETVAAELLFMKDAVNFILKNLKGWMKPQKRKTSPFYQPGKSFLYPQPLGMVGIISPWNVPIQLSLLPLAYAVAAGNYVMLKMSSYSANTSNLISKLFQESLPENMRDMVQIIHGSHKEAYDFAGLPFNHLFFTGSCDTGRKITKLFEGPSITLELGGKSPVIVADDYPITEAIFRILWNKMFNAGQICIAPDHIYLHHSHKELFINGMKEEVKKQFPNGFVKNDYYTSIINHKQFERLQNMLEDAKSKGAEIIKLSEEDDDVESRRFIPRLVSSVSEDMLLSQIEIFGPILPLIYYSDIDKVIDKINNRYQPLALYIFDNNKSRRKKILDRTVSGGVSINTTLTHAAEEDLPFGGIGASGYGKYHGKAGFNIFTHHRGVYSKGIFTPFDLGMKYPAILKFMLRIAFKKY